MSETQELYLTEPHTRSCMAKVIHADGRGIRLDRTIFHPEGDGMAGDAGHFEPFDGGNDLTIVDCVRDDDGTPIHVPQPGTAVAEVGARFNTVLNWDRRLKLMRLHSALHLVSALVGGTAIAASEVTSLGAWLDFDLGRPLPSVDELQREFDRLVQSNQPLTTHIVTRAELASYDSRLAAHPPPGDDPVTLVEVHGIDVQPCRGVHCEKTGELIRVEIERVERRSMAGYRVDIRLAG